MLFNPQAGDQANVVIPYVNTTGKSVKNVLFDTTLPFNLVSFDATTITLRSNNNFGTGEAGVNTFTATFTFVSDDDYTIGSPSINLQVGKTLKYSGKDLSSNTDYGLMIAPSFEEILKATAADYGFNSSQTNRIGATVTAGITNGDITAQAILKASAAIDSMSHNDNITLAYSAEGNITYQTEILDGVALALTGSYLLSFTGGATDIYTEKTAIEVALGNVSPSTGKIDLNLGALKVSAASTRTSPSGFSDFGNSDFSVKVGLYFPLPE